MSRLTVQEIKSSLKSGSSLLFLMLLSGCSWSPVPPVERPLPGDRHTCTKDMQDSGLCQVTTDPNEIEEILR